MLFPRHEGVFYIDSWKPDVDEAFSAAKLPGGVKVEDLVPDYFIAQDQPILVGFQRFMEAALETPDRLAGKARAIPLRDTNKVHQKITLNNLEVRTKGDRGAEGFTQDRIKAIQQRVEQEGLLSEGIVFGGFTVDAKPASVEYDDDWVRSQPIATSLGHGYLVTKGAEDAEVFGGFMAYRTDDYYEQVQSKMADYIPKWTPESIERGIFSEPVTARVAISNDFEYKRSAMTVRYDNVTVRLYDVTGDADGWGFAGPLPMG